MLDPRSKTNEAEEIEIVEAYLEAEEYLETGYSADDFYFDPEE